ncbi:MAG: hypothetical protein ABI551_07200 [Polyangiaceae bacterium]
MQQIPSSFAPYQPPPSPMTVKKERGMFLTAMLMLSTFWSIVSVFVVVLGGAAFDRATSSTGMYAVDSTSHRHIAQMVLALTIFQIIQLLSVVGMWGWKHLGVLGYFATTVVVVVASAKLVGSVPYITVIGAAFMLAAIFPKLGSFE